MRNRREIVQPWRNPRSMIRWHENPFNRPLTPSGEPVYFDEYLSSDDSDEEENCTTLIVYCGWMRIDKRLRRLYRKQFVLSSGEVHPHVRDHRLFYNDDIN